MSDNKTSMTEALGLLDWEEQRVKGLRDVFAGQAIVAQSAMIEEERPLPIEIADYAYAIADAMLKVRER